MPSAHVNGVRLNYVQMASPDEAAQEDLVMVHGLATNMAFWYFQYAALLSKRYRVTLYDLRGHGRSEMPAGGYTPYNLARDLQGLLDHLGIRRAHFLTHSFGGVVTLNMSTFDPDRVASLVLADTHVSAARHAGSEHAWGHGAQIQKILDASGMALDTRDPYFGYRLLTEVAHLQLRNQKVPPALEQLVSPLIGKHGNRTASQWLALMDDTAAGKELMGDDGLSLAALQKLRFPILAMYGDNSQARLTGKELLRVWPHAEFRRVRDAGHFFPTSRPAEVLQACEMFWGGEFTKRPKHRSGENQESHFRSDRIYQSEGAWYCLTREKTKIGPFAGQTEVREYLQSYISAMAAVPAE
ncbi:alpha/beta fold hydrolase [Piscinibacter sp.]|uniref:alpha/beta fold hydrolase n=1 Tax=Piscinibacter sp. TaxID=1903157 RepID=UPI002BEE22E8|nr:alpha/beta fold hydrolase [Albitalea sp.]HUG25191.1 alpha/beta fold hydrolase [Albitalea sp.]